MARAEVDFTYDIAFSFVREDEGLATQINDRLEGRYRTFLYSKAQEQLAGRDGEQTFAAVFGQQARTVAVLLRPEWGTTPWTRIEETAINNRAYTDGYDFTTFIVTAPGTATPQWLPRTRLWYDLERFGLEGVAAVLVARIQEHGGDTAEETLRDKAARLERAQRFKEQKETFAGSAEGVNAARAAHDRLVGDLKAQSEPLNIGRIQEYRHGNIFMIVGRGVVMTARYESPYVNSLKDAGLVVEFYDGVPHLPGLMADRERPRTLTKWKFTFELAGPGRTAWVGPDRKEHPQEQMADLLLWHFMDRWR